MSNISILEAETLVLLLSSDSMISSRVNDLRYQYNTYLIRVLSLTRFSVPMILIPQKAFRCVYNLKIIILNPHQKIN